MAQSDVVAKDIPAGSADVTVNNGKCSLFGWAFTAGATATTVIIRDGIAATDREIAKIPLAANAMSPPVWFGEQGIRMEKGIYVDLDGVNNVEGSVWYG